MNYFDSEARMFRAADTELNSEPSTSGRRTESWCRRGGPRGSVATRLLADRTALTAELSTAPTVRRTLDEITPAHRKKIAAARARARSGVGSAAGRVPVNKVAGTDLVTS